MRIPLAAMWRAVRNPRKRQVTLRPIKPPATFATGLYQSAYAGLIAAWERGLDAVMTEYERTLAQITQDSPADVGAAVGNVERDALAVLVAVEARLARWAERIERWHRQRWRAVVLSGTGVDIGTMIGPADARVTLEAVITRNVGLVRSVSEQTRQRIASAVFEGLAQRKPPRAVASELREAVAMSRRRALLIASDQASKLGGQLNEERRRQAGITQWKWVHSGKKHPREEHRARDGKIYGDDELLGDRPGYAINCGCTSAAHLDIDAMLAEMDLAA